ncbi:intraflagellar transport protein 25 homolog isoform X1 [Ursus maritimus]|uniref:Intraflagellar transport protein 25 homolog n=1 Tax=Ursus maritimus TaxID=29073 RepID=A0A8M1FIJ4_URSMA|nr:intraflagellar transport protein 25 homolog isoform X1 [Ursus maritimus]XP_040483209.1 intraflagellar transport protein 25 homolog isoform X1 [Ursus maritimus]XP_040483213.1 intraflagellar transport protein 25 homolog isoform X1 [Ursus maritimus]
MRKIDLCLNSEGAEVILATSSDEKHPPENMIDGNPETFWTTTGMFPQEFIICFHKHVRIERLVIQSYFVRTLRIEKSTSKEPVDFEPWIERDLVHTEGQLQNEEIMLKTLIDQRLAFPGQEGILPVDGAQTCATTALQPVSQPYRFWTCQTS